MSIVTQPLREDNYCLVRGTRTHYGGDGLMVGLGDLCDLSKLNDSMLLYMGVELMMAT